jgi:putative inorganic carbon (hco3(-)) transporter
VEAFLVVMGLAVAAAALALLVRIEPAWLISTGIALSCFSGNWRHMGLPPSLDRLIILLGVAVALLRGLRADRLRSLPLRVPHMVLGGLVLFVVCSAVWSGTMHGEAFFGLMDKFGVIPFALLLVAPLAFRTPAQRRPVLVVFAVLGFYLSVTALFEGANLDALVFPRYILDPSIGITVGRARGPFIAADSDGLAMFVCAVTCIIALRRWTSPGARAFAGFTIAACAAGIVLTLTRQIWVACLVASVVTVLVTPELRRYVVPGSVAVAAVVAVVFVAVPGFGQSASDRVNDQRSLQDRYNSNDAALRMVGARPVVGFGWYRFEAESTPYLRLARDYPLSTVGRVHNVFLSNAVELGVVATALWLFVLVYLILRGSFARGDPELVAWQRGVLAVALSWFVTANFTPLSAPFNNYVLWFWLGLGSVAWIWNPSDRLVPVRPRRGLRAAPPTAPA